MAHEVIVGNIGSVYSGSNGFQASVQYNTYVGQSKRCEGIASGESVVWIKDGDIYKEYVGTVDINEYQID